MTCTNLVTYVSLGCSVLIIASFCFVVIFVIWKEMTT